MAQLTSHSNAVPRNKWIIWLIYDCVWWALTKQKQKRIVRALSNEIDLDYADSSTAMWKEIVQRFFFCFVNCGIAHSDSQQQQQQHNSIQAMANTWLMRYMLGNARERHTEWNNGITLAFVLCERRILPLLLPPLARLLFQNYMKYSYDSLNFSTHIYGWDSH